ncbi:hypothetical protein ACFE04_011293 [Oxalis oulophora]
MLKLQHFMFQEDPADTLAKLDIGQSGGACGATWSNTDIAYTCWTCGLAKYLAICASCFQNGNHKGHNYTFLHTNVGSCDCGDVTLWKREVFCSKHVTIFAVS